MGFNYSRGAKDRPLKKKNLKWYCNRIIQYAHEGKILTMFLRDHYLDKDQWDKYVKKHKALQVAMVNAKERTRGWMYEQLYITALTTKNVNPQMFKVLTTNNLGWTDKINESEDDEIPPTIIFSKGPPPDYSSMPDELKHLIPEYQDKIPTNPDGSLQETGEKGGNGKGGNGAK